MIIKELHVRQGFLYTKRKFESGINLIFSEKNSTGKTTLLRCLLYSLGYNIPGTKKLHFNSINTKVLIQFDDSKTIFIERLNPNSIKLVDGVSEKTYVLPTELNSLHFFLFGTSNEDILNNLLGAFYADQEKGWTLLNRGKAIAGIRFNIDELIRGLSDRNCDELLARKKAIEESIRKYKHILNIAQYRDTLSEKADELISIDYNEELFLQAEQLRIECSQIKKELVRLDDNISNNRKIVDIIDKMKLLVKLPNGEEMRVTKNNVVGYEDSIDFLIAKRRILLPKYKDVMNKLASLERTIEMENRQISLFETESFSEQFDKKILSIPVNMVEIQRIITGLEKEKTLVDTQIKKKTNSENPITKSLFDTVKKYMTELGDATAADMSWKYLFTSNLKELSGAVLHKTVFSFRLAYITEIQKVLGIKLPILLDSPKGKEVDQDNINQMMSILKRDFADNQVIIASIYHYVDGEHVIEMKGQLLDKFESVDDV